MKRKYKEELQSIYEMAQSDDLESKDLAINLFWTSNYVKESNIKPTMRLLHKKDNELRLNIGHYLDDNNIVKYNNFSEVVDNYDIYVTVSSLLNDDDYMRMVSVSDTEYYEKLMDYISTLEKCLGREAKKEFLPMQPGDVPVTFADTSALERDFGFKPSTSLREGLRAFAQWYKEYYG